MEKEIFRLVNSTDDGDKDHLRQDVVTIDDGAATTTAAGGGGAVVGRKRDLNLESTDVSKYQEVVNSSVTPDKSLKLLSTQLNDVEEATCLPKSPPSRELHHGQQQKDLLETPSEDEHIIYLVPNNQRFQQYKLHRFSSNVRHLAKKKIFLPPSCHAQSTQLCKTRLLDAKHL